MPLHQPPGYLGKAAVADAEWSYPLPAQDALPERYHARHLYSGLPALHPTGQPSAVQNRSRRFCEPLDFIARLAALVPRPRVNLTRYHGVFAPNSKHRALVTPAKRGKGNKRNAAHDNQERTPAERRASMSWAQRLKRVFNIDIEICGECGGAVKVIASIEDLEVIRKIPSFGPLTVHPCTTPLDHLKKKGEYQDAVRLPENRGPPQTTLFD